MNERCGNCRFFLLDTKYPPTGGLCRRFPPTVIGAGLEDTNYGFTIQSEPARPWVALDEWCGEHSPVGEQ